MLLLDIRNNYLKATNPQIQKSLSMSIATDLKKDHDKSIRKDSQAALANLNLING